MKKLLDYGKLQGTKKPENNKELQIMDGKNGFNFGKDNKLK